jgi:hypothetical protein
VAQLPRKIEKAKAENEQELHDGPDDEEGSESSEEEEENPLKNLRRSTQKTRQPYRYNYSPSNFKCPFSLFANTNVPTTVKWEIVVEDNES